MSTANGNSGTDVATVASGCFWGTEHIFREHFGQGKGLLDAKVGFIGGKDSSKDPSYQEVCSGKTGHAEATQIKFDPVSGACCVLLACSNPTDTFTTIQSKVTYAELIEFCE